MTHELVVVEAEWNGAPTFYVRRGRGALWRATDDGPIWTSRHELAWHTPDRAAAERVVAVLKTWRQTGADLRDLIT